MREIRITLEDEDFNFLTKIKENISKEDISWREFILLLAEKKKGDGDDGEQEN